MAGVVANLWAKLGMDTKQFEKGIKKARGDLQKFTGGTITARNAVKAFAGAAGLAYAGKQIFDLGAAVEETGSKFRTVFGPETEAAQQMLDEFASSAGLSNEEAQDLLATTGAIVQGMGLAQKASREYSEEVVRLAGDFASFNNIPIQETSRAIQAAITGEREQLKRLGVVILETDVQKRALMNTGKEAAGALTQEEKATATLQLITEKAGVAVGDLARTQDSAANRARKLTADFKTMRDTLAAALLPALADVLQALQGQAIGMEEFTKKIAENVPVVTAWARVVVASFGVVWDIIKNVAKTAFDLGQAIGHLIMVTDHLMKGEFKEAAEAGKRFGSEFVDIKDNILDVAGSFANLSDASALAWDEMEYGARRAAEAIATVQTAVANSAAGTTGGGGGGGGTISLPTPEASPMSFLAENLKTIGSDEVRANLQGTMDTVTNGLTAAQSAAVGFGDQFANAMVSATTQGADAFKGFADSVIQQLQRIAAQAILFKILDFAFPGAGIFGQSTLGALLNRETNLDRANI